MEVNEYKLMKLIDHVKKHEILLVTFCGKF
jgi:hypothetical protein